MAKTIVALLAVCLLSFPMFAQEDVEEVLPLNPAEAAPLPGGAVNETPGVWFIELSGAPAADGGSLNALRNEKNAFRNAAKKAGVVYTERYSYDTLFNGLSVQMDVSEVGKVSRLSGVKRVWPVVTESLPPRTREADGEMITAMAMTGADIVRNTLGYTGAGIKVGILDTGVDYHHPDLGGCFGPGCRVAVGYDFVGDAYNNDSSSSGYNPVPSPDLDPDDCNGHGTHVAGIVGASGVITGVAPDVTFGAYRVFGCAGSTSADIMIAAMERVLADGMQVLNMSIGSSFQWPEYPTAAAANRLVNRGVSVVASIGNSGANGLYSSSAPGVGEKVIGVASVTNTHTHSPAFTVSPDDRKIAYGNATAAPPAPLSGSAPLTRSSAVALPTDDACSAFPAGTFTGKVVLVRRGTCGFYDKSLNVQNAGAAGVVLYNNAAGAFNPTVAGPTAITIPVVAISDVDGILLSGRIAAGPVTLTWTADVVSVPNAAAGLIASSSSWGLSPDLSLKPDIAAPGANIRSTYPLEFGAYASISGTSMASPHTAGAVALLLEAKPKTPASAIRDILQNSASPKLWSGNPGLGFLEMAHRQGAGTLRIDQAITADSRIEPGKLSLGESQGGPATRTLTVTNASTADVTYNLTHSAALSTGSNTFTVGAFTGFATVSFSSPTLVVPAKSSATVDVTITANPALGDRSIYGGYLVFTPVGGGQTLRVPYSGFKGDYQSIAVLTPTANGFPWLAQLDGSYWNRPSGGTYTMSGTDVAYILVHLDHQSRRIRGEVFDAVTGKAMHRAFDEEFVGRNSTATGIFALAWDGVTRAGNKTYVVPNGTYVLRLSVLKALGDESNPAHWETWTSPTITIARP